MARVLLRAVVAVVRAVVGVTTPVPAAGSAAPVPDVNGVAAGNAAIGSVDLAGRWSFTPAGRPATTITVPGGGWYKQGFTDVSEATYSRTITVPESGQPQSAWIEFGALIRSRQLSSRSTIWPPAAATSPRRAPPATAAGGSPATGLCPAPPSTTTTPCTRERPRTARRPPSATARRVVAPQSSPATMPCSGACAADQRVPSPPSLHTLLSDTVREESMSVSTRISRLMAAAGLPLVLALSAASYIVADAPGAQAATVGPCDIYASGGTPCVAAHSTTRALYGAYNGPLYQVRRSSDNTTKDIGVLSEGGVADAAAQDAFCASTNCVITVIYDQSGRNNRLTQAMGGGVPGPGPGGSDNLADAKAAPISIGGQKAYGVYIAPGTGYRNNNTNGIAKGDQPEGIYAVLDGTHYNDGCCFDYGNAQTNAMADDIGIMETIYFGNNKVWGYGDGSGPWIMADMEWGLFTGVNARYNPMPPISHRFLTAIVKGEPNHWAIRGGNAQSGGLTTLFDGRRPNGYHPMKKEGAILLGIGGDNSNTARGTFYEGVMTSGYPTAATEDAVQANITAAAYAPGDPQQGAQIVGGASSRCVEVPNGSTTNGTQAQLWDCGSASQQRWTHTAGRQLQVYGNKCLDASGRGTSNGTQVVIWDCHGQNNQQWNVNANGTITSVQSGLCLDANGAGSANGTKLILWACHGGSNQQWKLRS